MLRKGAKTSIDLLFHLRGSHIHLEGPWRPLLPGNKFQENKLFIIYRFMILCSVKYVNKQVVIIDQKFENLKIQ